MDDSYRWRSRSPRRGEATVEMVEERLAELDESGILPAVDLDERAQAALRDADPRIALQALDDWERTSDLKRRNPSACMVSLLRNLERGGRAGEADDSGDPVAQRELEELIEVLDDQLDGNARASLAELTAQQAVVILNDVVKKGDSLKNPSAFVVSVVKKHRDADRKTSTRRQAPAHIGAVGGHQRSGRHRANFDVIHESLERLKDQLDTDLDARARAALDSLEPLTQVEILKDLVQNYADIRNMSAYVESLVRGLDRRGDDRDRWSDRQSQPPFGGRGRSAKDWRGRSVSEARERQHPPVVEKSWRVEPPGQQDGGGSRDTGRNGLHRPTQEGTEPSEDDMETSEAKEQVRGIVGACDLIDDKAKDVLLQLEPQQVLEVMKLLLDKSDTIRNPSAFVCKAAGDLLHKDVVEEETATMDDDPPGLGAPAAGSSSHGGAGGNGSQGKRPQVEAVCFPHPKSAAPLPPAAPVANEKVAESGPQPAGDWRSLDLHSWLQSVDNGKGFLMQYEESLLNNYDTLDQIVELYVQLPGPNGSLRMDTAFFEDLGVEKVGHRRLIEKWFKDHL